MGLDFLTPLAALFGLAALVPLAVSVRRERRAGRIRGELGLAEPMLRSRLPLGLALVAVPGLLALAAAQPVLAKERVVRERTDAEVFVVLDISRSMLASAGPDAPTRFQRARRAALDLRDRLPEVPMGVASLTTRVLPHLFPTTDRRVFAATIGDSVQIESPPPSLFAALSTSYDALSAVPRFNYFTPSVRKRVLVVLSDGETRPLETDLVTPFRRLPRIETIFVRFWDGGEEIYETGVAEPGYNPDRGSGATLARIAALIGGRVIAEDEIGTVSGAIRSFLGRGPTRERRIEGERFALMPYITLLVILPLGFVLLRRNFPVGVRPPVLLRRLRPRPSGRIA